MEDAPPSRACSSSSANIYATKQGGIAAHYYLPFYKQIKLPPPPEEVPFLPTLVQEACGFKIITGGMMGG
jgi:hypothetical protein